MIQEVIPDCQVSAVDDFTFLRRIGNYLVDKQPEVIVCIGDFADMPSLSSYDVGSKSYEGRRYLADVAAAQQAMFQLMRPIQEYNAMRRRNGKKQYLPRLELTLGNHEHRINRAVNKDAKLDGLISTNDLAYSRFGWKVHDFLEVVIIDGIAYSHYFVTGVAGRPASSAAAQIRKTNMSCVAGHQQGLQIATANRADGALLTSVIAGSCYEHEEQYLGPQGNKHWRGILMLNDVENGAFDLMPVSLKYLKEKYD